MAPSETNTSQIDGSSKRIFGLSAQQDQLLRHDNAWLAGQCVVNALTILIIIFRSLARARTTKAFRSDDYLMIISGVLTIFPAWVAEIGGHLMNQELEILENDSPSMKNLDVMFTRFLLGYYLVCSTIKISMCCCILHMVPKDLFRYLHLSIYILQGVIAGLGIASALVMVFPCQPLQSNFSWNVARESCSDDFSSEVAWLLISVGIDAFLVGIPLALLRLAKLHRYQRRALFVVFGTSVLGTICCLCRVYPAYRSIRGQTTPLEDVDIGGWNWILGDLEILLYTIGASMPVVSKKVVSIFSHTATLECSTEAGRSITGAQAEHKPPFSDNGLLDGTNLTDLESRTTAPSS